MAIYCETHCETVWDRGLCEIQYVETWGICGTDDQTYHDIRHLKCVQRSNYGKRVNLQFKYDCECTEWRFMGIHLKMVARKHPYIPVSKLRIDSTSID